jgi:hypothetical protein
MATNDISKRRTAPSLGLPVTPNPSEVIDLVALPGAAPYATQEFVYELFNKLKDSSFFPATDKTLGCVIIGSGLTVDADGRIDVVFPSHVDYLTKTDAESTYAKLSALTDYLTKTAASSTYATKQELADLDLTGDYVPLIQDKNGGLSAATVGERSTDGSDQVGVCSFSSGIGNIASGNYSHAEGESVIAKGPDSHAEGCTTEAAGYCSHAEGKYTTAAGAYSHAAGYRAKAQRNAYAWSGVESDTAYESNGDGTYNINPANGIEGFYIGQKNLKTILSEKDKTELHALVPETSEGKVTLKPVDGAANWLEEPIDTTAAGTVRSFNLTINWSIDVEFWDESMEDYNWIGLDLKPLVLSSDTPGLTFTGVVYERESEIGSHIYYLTFKLDEGHDLPVYLSSDGEYGEIEVGRIKQHMLDDGTFYIKIERYDSPLPEGLLSFNGSHNLEEFFDEYFDYNDICSSLLGAWDLCFGCVPLPDVISEVVGIHSIRSDIEMSGGGNALTIQIPSSPESSNNARFFSLALTSDATDESDVTWQGGEVIEAIPGASKLVPGLNVWDVAEVAPGKFRVDRASSPAQSAPLTLTAPNGRVAELAVDDDLVLEVKEVE